MNFWLFAQFLACHHKVFTVCYVYPYFFNHATLCRKLWFRVRPLEVWESFVFPLKCKLIFVSINFSDFAVTVSKAIDLIDDDKPSSDTTKPLNVEEVCISNFLKNSGFTVMIVSFFLNFLFISEFELFFAMYVISRISLLTWRGFTFH